MNILSEIVEQVNEFWDTDFKKGVRELTICSEDRDSLLKASNHLEDKFFGFYKVICSVSAEYEGRTKKYQLNIGFDKL